MGIPETLTGQFPALSVCTFVDITSVWDLFPEEKDAGEEPPIEGLTVAPPWLATVGCIRAAIGDFAIVCAFEPDSRHVWLAANAGSPGNPFRRLGAVEFYLNEEMQVPRSLEMEIKIPPELAKEHHHHVQPLLTTLSRIFMTAMAFCHCRNIKIVKEPISRQVRRRAERTGTPIIEHHSLVIEPMKKILIRDGGYRGKSDFNRAMHICRGHFCQYGEKYGKGKLFGKIEGQVWIPQHVRGSLDNGVITKDYKVAIK